jgi:GcrA cell cycle regulator
MTAAQKTWTKERVALLKDRINAGFTCGQIAGEMGVSRNAVIGKASRLGLLGQRASARTTTPSRIRGRQARPQATTPQRTLRVLWAQPQLSCGEVPESSANRCSLFELREWHCRWPIGDPTAKSFGFCGNKPVHGLPYCAAHARIGYRPSGRAAATSRRNSTHVQR